MAHACLAYQKVYKKKKEENEEKIEEKKSDNAREVEMWRKFL